MKILNIKSQTNQNGFTLVELLVVIGILGLLAVGSIIALNPVQRFNKTKDNVAKQGVQQVGTALQSYYATNQSYPAILSDITGPTLELKSIPNGADGSPLTYVITPSGCVTATTTTPGTCTDAAVYFTLEEPVGTNTVWCWNTASGRPAAVANAAACTPNAAL